MDKKRVNRKKSKHGAKNGELDVNNVLEFQLGIGIYEIERG